MSSFRTNILETVQVARKCFLFFATFASRLSSNSIYMPFYMPMLSPDSDPFCDILNLIDVANIFAADSILQSVASDAS